MMSAVKLQLLINPPPITHLSYSSSSSSLRLPYDLRLPPHSLAAPLSVHSHSFDSPQTAESEQSISSLQYTASVVSPPPVASSSVLQLSQWNLTQRHIFMLNVVACVVSVSATWLFFSAIPALLAFRRAVESLEKLMDATREELPDTMAAIRLSGMEISDLTMEISDLGQEITQGVKSSTRAVRLAEERLRKFTDMTSPVSLQSVASPKTEAGGPALARTARGIKEGIVKGRAFFQMLFTLTRFSRMALNYVAKRPKQ